jgi:3-phenylpropionate/cinnamic acid dioxygenase small subunit
MSAPTDLHADVERFLYHEATLLDSGRFEEWLALFTEDAVYWVPSVEGAGGAAPDGQVIYDDHLRLRARVGRLRHALNPTQFPPPRTRHFITNVVVDARSADEVEAASNQIVYVVQGSEQVQFPGACEHLLRREEGQWRIRQKKITLLAGDLPLVQLPVL